MTYQIVEDKPLTEEEWNELIALNNAIHDDPFSVVPEHMEKFSFLMVRSLRERGG
tara:strand:- start:659 stop:823 length:165 start_codon:yes stop_codon:yes gene_type:complete